VKKELQGFVGIEWEIEFICWKNTCIISPVLFYGRAGNIKVAKLLN
jgi:hypothetical protein